MNWEKTNVFFGKAVVESTKKSKKNFLGVSKIKDYEKYIGLPAIVGDK